MAGDYGRIHRLLRILTLIQSEPGWKSTRLALECQTSARNVYRDIAVLRAAGIPVEYDAQLGGYRVRKEFFLPAVELTLDESLALVALAEHIGGKEQIPMMGAAARAIEKVRCNLPARVQQELALIDPHLNIQLQPAGPADQIKDVYQKMRLALVQKRALQCEYDAVTKEGDGRPFLFEPYTLFFSQRAWYAVGYHHGRRGLRTLKLNRFCACGLTARRYTIPKSFSLQKHLGNAWRMMRGDKTYDVELWFDPAFAQTIEDTHWHKTQQVRWQADGSIVFKVKVDGLEEIIWWILSMGPHCVVRKPAELAQRIGDLASAVVHRYESASPPAPAARAGSLATVG